MRRTFLDVDRSGADRPAGDPRRRRVTMTPSVRPPRSTHDGWQETKQSCTETPLQSTDLFTKPSNKEKKKLHSEKNLLDVNRSGEELAQSRRPAGDPRRGRVTMPSAPHAYSLQPTPRRSPKSQVTRWPHADLGRWAHIYREEGAWELLKRFEFWEVARAGRRQNFAILLPRRIHGLLSRWPGN
jgi:hypothetical protein